MMSKVSELPLSACGFYFSNLDAIYPRFSRNNHWLPDPTGTSNGFGKMDCGAV